MDSRLERHTTPKLFLRSEAQTRRRDRDQWYHVRLRRLGTAIGLTLSETRHRNSASFGPKDRQRQRRVAQAPEFRGPGISMTREDMPAAVSGAPTSLSPVVRVMAESRERFPWLPARVIAGSVWRGPSHERVRVDLGGRAEPVTVAPRRF